MSSGTELVIGGKRLKVSNLDKVLYPETGFTKGQVIDFYIRIAPMLLPHLRNRALTLKRYPNGVREPFFYEKRCPSFRPPWIKTAPIWSRGNQETIHYCLVNDLPSLVWAANLADLEIHTSLACWKNPNRPTMMVFDLDPGPPADVLDCAEVALWLRDFFNSISLECCVKTSGSKGLQVYVPLNTPVTFEETKAYARNVAEFLTAKHPQKIVFRMEKALRSGKVLIDWSQNDDHKTTVCVYSLRAKEPPTVSTPLAWDELDRARRARKAVGLQFEPEAVLQRVQSMGDIFAPVLELKQKLPRWAGK
jgi:bifunctional non-homologous end joining protein LigD